MVGAVLVLQKCSNRKRPHQIKPVGGELLQNQQRWNTGAPLPALASCKPM